MKTSDIVIARVLDPDGTPKAAVGQRAGDRVEKLWEVRAHGRDPVARHPFSQPLETAGLWQEHQGGDMYRHDVTDASLVLVEKRV